MIRLLDVIFDSKYPVKDKITFLETCRNTGSFKDEDAEDVDLVCRKIKSLLSTTAGRTEGLLLLKMFLDECSAEPFAENANSWTQLTLKVLKCPGSVVDKNLACLTFQQLFPLLPQFPAIFKQVATSVVSPLIDTLLRVTPEDEWVEEAIDLLLCCMKTFPGACGAHKSNIESFIVKHLGQWQKSLLEPLAGCISMLPWCSGGGIHGANHSSAWTTQVDNLLASLDRILDHFYEGADIYEEGSPLLLSSLELPTVPNDDLLQSMYWFHEHFQFLGLCLLQMLSDEHDTPAKVPVDDVVSFVWKALSVNSVEMLSKPSMDAIAIASLIPAIHNISLSILEALIYGFRRQIDRHARTINHILLRSLDWTDIDEVSYGTEKPYCGVRSRTYQVFQVWVQTLGPVSGVHKQGEAFVKHCLNDLRIEQDHVQLQSRSDQDRPRGRKRKRKHHAEAFAAASASQKMVHKQANRELCLQALNALKCCIYACGPLLEIDSHKEVHSVVLRILSEFQSHCPSRNASAYLIPYSSAACRRELYAVLLACVLRPNYHWPPPLQPAISIFERGRLDTNIQVSSFCTEGMSVLSSILHPCVTTWKYVEQQVDSEMGRPVSNRVSNMSESSLQQSLHVLQESKKEDFSPAYSHETVAAQVSNSRKETPPWRLQEQAVNVEQLISVLGEHSERATHSPALQQAPIPLAQPPVPAQLIKAHPTPSHPLPAVPSVQQAKRQATQPPMVIQRTMGRGPQRPSEEVVLVSEGDSAEENHMEEDEEEEEEEDEEEEEEEGEYYHLEGGEYTENFKRAIYRHGDVSPSQALAGGRSAEDSSSTGIVVSSIVGNLVTEAVGSHMQVPAPRVQKARRTGVLASSEHSHPDEEEVRDQMRRHHHFPHEEEEEEEDYEGEEDEDYDEEEDEEVIGRECEDEEEEIQEIDDQNSSDQLYGQMIEEGNDETPQDNIPILIPECQENLAPVDMTQDAGGQEEEEEDQQEEEEAMAVFQILQPVPTQDVPIPHSEENSSEQKIPDHEDHVSQESEKDGSNQMEVKISEVYSQDGDCESNEKEAECDIIELSDDSPVKDCHSVVTSDRIATLPNSENEEGLSQPEFIVHRLDEADIMETATRSLPVASENIVPIISDRLEEKDDVPCTVISEMADCEATEDAPVETTAEEAKSQSQENGSHVMENNVSDLNHSTGKLNNCASDEDCEEEGRPMNNFARSTESSCTPPDSPEGEPPSKKVCMMVEEEETLEEMLSDFVKET